jgi:hypothetical protein
LISNAFWVLARDNEFQDTLHAKHINALEPEETIAAAGDGHVVLFCGTKEFLDKKD